MLIWFSFLYSHDLYFHWKLLGSFYSWSEILQCHIKTRIFSHQFCRALGKSTQLGTSFPSSLKKYLVFHFDDALFSLLEPTFSGYWASYIEPISLIFFLIFHTPLSFYSVVWEICLTYFPNFLLNISLGNPYL